MLKSLLVTVCLGFSLYAFAGDEEAICDYLKYPAKCNAAWQCFWDYEDNRCEPTYNPPSHVCRRYNNNRVSCNADPRCFFDLEDNRCERI